MRISDWSSDVCSSDLVVGRPRSAGTLLRAEFRPPRRHRLDRGDERLARRARWPLDGIRAAAEPGLRRQLARAARSEEHTSELQSLMRTSYAVFCLTKK